MPLVANEISNLAAIHVIASEVYTGLMNYGQALIAHQMKFMEK